MITIDTIKESSEFAKDKEFAAFQIEKIRNDMAIFYSLEKTEFILEKVIQKCENNQDEGNPCN